MIKFNLDATQHVYIAACSDHYPLHPYKIIISKLDMHETKPHMDRLTGKNAAIVIETCNRNLQIRDMNLANKRRKLRLKQLDVNNNMW